MGLRCKASTAADRFGDFAQASVTLPSGGRSSPRISSMTSFVAIDFETATARRDSACAVGLAAGCGGRIVLARTYLIRPLEAQFPFTGLHGIRWEDVRDAPTFADLWPVLRAWTDAAAFIAAHNAPFDRSVLHACCARYRLRPPRTPFACTVQLARAHWGIYPTKLPDVCRRLRIGLRHHDAGADALACARIVLAAQAEGWRPKRRATRFITASRQWRAAAARRDRGHRSGPTSSRPSATASSASSASASGASKVNPAG